MIAGLEDFAPPTIFAQASRLHFSTGLYNLLTTNVPGPQFPLYLLGREMKELRARSRSWPRGSGWRSRCMSYNGTVAISLIGDYDGMPDLEELAGYVTDEVAALREAAKSATMAPAA